jgi:hypothetical protein
MLANHQGSHFDSCNFLHRTEGDQNVTKLNPWYDLKFHCFLFTTRYSIFHKSGFISHDWKFGEIYPLTYFESMHNTCPSQCALYIDTRLILLGFLVGSCFAQIMELVVQEWLQALHFILFCNKSQVSRSQLHQRHIGHHKHGKKEFTFSKIVKWLFCSTTTNIKLEKQ